MKEALLFLQDFRWVTTRCSLKISEKFSRIFDGILFLHALRGANVSDDNFLQDRRPTSRDSVR